MTVPVGRPDPSKAADIAEFSELLAELVAQAGAPTHRELAKRVGPRLKPPRVVSKSTISELLRPGRRRLDLDLVVALVRAVGADEPSVDRWRQACIRVHGTAKTGGPAGVFRQLPADLSTFIGRTKELARLIDTATEQGTVGPPTVVISAIEGMAGVGKTQLAVHAAHELIRAGRYSDVQLYVNLRGFDPEQPPADPAAVLDAFLRQLEVPAQQIPDGLDERAAMFRDRMHGRDALVLLDDAADEAQARELIPASPSCLVLITSRRSLAGLDGTRSHVLDVFTFDESLKLLSAIAGDDRIAAEPEAAADLVEAVGRLPLAVSLIAARLRARPAWTLTELLRRLRSDGLDAVRAGDRALRPVFTMSFDGLSGRDKAVFRAIGVHPGVDYTAAALAAAAGMSETEADQSLENLVREHLVRDRAPGRFEAHDLVRAFAREIADADPSEVRHAALNRLAVWYLHSAHAAATAIRTFNLPFPDPGDGRSAIVPLEFESYDEALAWYDAERENVHSVQRVAAAAGLTQVAWQMPAMLKQFMTLRAHWTDYLESHLLAAQTARRVGDDQSLAFVLLGVGVSLRALSRLDEAEAAFDEALLLYRALGDEGQEGTALSELAYVYRVQGRTSESIDAHLSALAIFDRVGNHRGAMVCRLNVAGAYDDAGQPQLAAEMCRLALADARKLGDGRAECIITGNIAQLQLQSGEFELSYATYVEHQRLSQAVDDRQQRGRSAAGIGDSLHGMRRTGEARQHWAEALAIFEDIGSGQAAEVRKLLDQTS
ncbi:MAG: tetratricopeptide repeat protein [Catenulispora sp.]|nr:tetratricopeptide repeat protein [Catenulispora sp.]